MFGARLEDPARSKSPNQVGYVVLSQVIGPNGPRGRRRRCLGLLLSEQNLSGKIIVPFCTRGGGGLGRIVKDVAKLCPQSTILDGFEVNGSGSADTKARLFTWLRVADIARQV